MQQVSNGGAYNQYGSATLTCFVAVGNSPKRGIYKACGDVADSRPTTVGAGGFSDGRY